MRRTLGACIGILVLSQFCAAFRLPAGCAVAVRSSSENRGQGHGSFVGSLRAALETRYDVHSCDVSLRQLLRRAARDGDSGGRPDGCPVDFVIAVAAYNTRSSRVFSRAEDNAMCVATAGVSDSHLRTSFLPIPMFIPRVSGPRYRHAVSATISVYDTRTGECVHESRETASRKSTMSSGTGVLDGAAAELGKRIARMLFRGRAPELAVQAFIGAVAPIGSNVDKFNMTDGAGTGVCAGGDVTAIFVKYFGMEAGYEYHQMPFDPLPSDSFDVSGYYEGNALHVSLMLGSRITTPAMGYVFPYLSMGLKGLWYDEVVIVDGQKGNIDLEPTAALLIGGGVQIRPGWVPVVFTLFARMGIGYSAYRPEDWEVLRQYILDNNPGASLPRTCPDYNVCHAQVGIKLGWAY